MEVMTVDQLPDLLETEYPGKGLTCLANFETESIIITKNGKTVASFKEAAFDEEFVTEDVIRQTVTNYLKTLN